jgi:aconitate hydratase
MTNFVEKSQLSIGNNNYQYFPIIDHCKKLNLDISNLPFSLKILIENMIRCYEDQEMLKNHLISICKSVKNANHRIEIDFTPARVLLQDFTGVPVVVDLATMRNAVKKINQDPKKINPLVPVDLVIDHSVQVDFSGDKTAFEKNVELEFSRNKERYEFLKWAQESFDNFRVVPPGTGICHQVNLENLASVVATNKNSSNSIAYFDTVVGTDSHTTMINGLGVLGWGVGGIEAEAGMLGQPSSMLIPEVIGFKLTKTLSAGVTSTDLVLTITQILRKKGVVGKFVEFFGDGVKNLSLANRATIANMAPEYGATCGIFPIDQITLDYLELTGRSKENIELVKNYAKAQGVFEDQVNICEYSEVLELDLSTVVPSVAGPKRPQDRINLNEVIKSFENLQNELKSSQNHKISVPEINGDIADGDIVISAITSCTNTSNPSVLITAGLLAKKAVEQGLKIKSHVKTSLAPGSQVVSQYLIDSGLQKYLDQLGYQVVGYGCTTCIGNSGPIHPKLEEIIKEKNLTIASILSGNRNFEGRIHPLVKANYLASPPLVIAYALAGTIKIDLNQDPIGINNYGKNVYLKDIWPDNKEVEEIAAKVVTRKLFSEKYQNLFLGDKLWQDIKILKSDTYNFDLQSTYIRMPNYFDQENQTKISDINNAKILAIFGDSITTDHISPAGNISASSPAAQYLNQHHVERKDFNSYGTRRGNHEVMMRGTFANVRIKNEMLGGVKEGGFTKNQKDEILPIYDVAMEYKNQNIPLVVIAGKEYGSGSSRDWAAKGVAMLGVKAIIAESFERIHRSNLIGMGVLPLIFKSGINRKTLELIGNEQIDILGIDNKILPKQNLKLVIKKSDGTKIEQDLICGLDTTKEVEYYKINGILPFVINQILK